MLGRKRGQKKRSERETERQRQRQRERGREEGTGEGEKIRGEKRGSGEGACLEQILYNSSLLFEDCQGLLLVDSLCEQHRDNTDGSTSLQQLIRQRSNVLSCQQKLYCQSIPGENEHSQRFHVGTFVLK